MSPTAAEEGWLAEPAPALGLACPGPCTLPLLPDRFCRGPRGMEVVGRPGPCLQPGMFSPSGLWVAPVLPPPPPSHRIFQEAPERARPWL